MSPTNPSNLGQSTQSTMSQPPTMISTKDLTYLKEAMSWELLAFKKCRQYASFCTDSEIQQELDRTGQMHQQHYSKLLNYLQTNTNQNYVQ